VEIDLAHPLFDAVRPWYARLGGAPSLERLNALATEMSLQTESGKRVTFVAPAPSDPYYEVQVFETGRVQTRPDCLHDLFNALAWLAFPRTKARINAMHAAEIPRERGRRGRRRDLLTIFDEGGAIIACADEELVALLRAFRWKELFWTHRERVRAAMRCIVLGHAVMEQALAPRPGITCKALLICGGDADAQAAERLPVLGSPKDLAALPVYGLPGWYAQDEQFYGDTRYFRPG
jgi:Protein of unknown function (DUF3025)